MSRNDITSRSRDIRRVSEFITQYQTSLRELFDELPTKPRIISLQRTAVFGRAEIWPCRDAAVVLIYDEPNKKPRVVVHDFTSRTATDFLRLPPAAEMIEIDGRRSVVKVSIDLPSPGLIAWLGPFLLERPGGTFARSTFDKLGILAWDAQLPSARKVAVEAFQADYAALNILDESPPTLSPAAMQRPDIRASETAQQLIAEYRTLLALPAREEELQRYLALHPVLVYPDYVEVQPKYKLGAEYVTDYLFIVQGYQGREHVFVEIERPAKPILTESGQFSSAFTQAKDQLLNWEHWISVNHAYAAAALPGLYRPVFHLVMGRNETLPGRGRQKLVTEFSATARRFSTFDDLADRFQQIVSRLASHDKPRGYV